MTRPGTPNPSGFSNNVLIATGVRPAGGVPLRTVLVLAVLLLAVPALAQTHQHATGKNGERFVVLHDGPADGRALVGGLTHFGFALVDKDGAPVRHQDATFTLTQNGVVLFASDATHEYDGLFTFDTTFTVPGPYEVLVESGTGASATFTGEAVLPVPSIATTSEILVPEGLAAGMPGAFTIQVLDANGSLVSHSDALLEIRRADGLLVLRNHFHTHDEPIAVDLAFAQPGEYVAEVLGYLAFPSAGLPGYTTSLGTAAFAVDAALPVAAPAAPELALPAASAAPARPDAGGEHAGYVLTAIDDPGDPVGPLQHVRLAAFVWDENATAALQHVNFRASVRGPGGFVPFESASLHEYDGHLEIVLSQLPPGLYTFSVEAEYDEWTDAKEITFTILPPVVPLGAGPTEVVLEGADGLQAGVPAELAFRFQQAGAGVLVPHSEVDVAAFQEGLVGPVFLAKIHTHMDAPKATVTFPTPGEYTLRIDPDSLQASPTLVAGDGGLGGVALVKVSVGDGPGLPAPPEPVGKTVEDAPVQNALPAGGLLAALVALAGGALRRRA